MNDSDAYEFDVPDELKEWIEYQQSNSEEFSRLRLGYVLERGRIKQTDWLKAALWWETHPNEMRVDQTIIKGTNENREIWVSTVFLFINHNFGGEGKPILFETMVFGGKHDQYCRRYASFGEAKTGHWEIVEMVKNDCGK